MLVKIVELFASNIIPSDSAKMGMRDRNNGVPPKLEYWRQANHSGSVATIPQQG